jgi:hypothetical protein
MKLKIIKICGVNFPPADSLQEVWNLIEDDDSKKEFIRISNEVICRIDKMFNPEKYLEGCINSSEIQLLKMYFTDRLFEWRRACIIDGYDKPVIEGIEYNPQKYLSSSKEEDIHSYHEYIKGMKRVASISPKTYPLIENVTALIIWYIEVIGTPSAGNAQQNRKTTVSIIRMLEGSKDLHPLKKKEKVELPEFNNCPTYSLAKDFFTAQRKEEAMASIDSLEMQLLLLLNHEIILSLNSPFENTDKGIYRSFCQYCKEYFFTDQKKPPTCCEKCKTARNTASRQKSRSSDIPEEISQWKEAFDGKRRDCIECEKKRPVNEARICEKCFDKSHSG